MNPRALAKLQKTWAAKLAASGFQDLESDADRDAPLSNRGKLHDGTSKVKDSAHVQGDAAGGDGDFQSLAARVEHGQAYTDWANSVLHKLNGQGTKAKRRRQIWGMHCEGWSMKGIARELGINFHVARLTVNRIEERYKACPETSLQRAAREVPTATLALLVATIFRRAGQRLPTRRSSST
jgi:hypothetical protein